MHRFIQIFGILIIYLVCGAPSCNDKKQGSAEQEQNSLKASIDSLRESFGSGHLSAVSLEAFEVSASQKLPEFADYLCILGDTSLNSSFKDKAREMIRELFLSEDVKFPVTNGARLKERELTLKQILSDKVKPAVLSYDLVLDSVRIGKHFQRTDDTTYTGMLNFTLRYTGAPPSVENMTRFTGNTMDIFILKRNRIFGKDTLRVWKVCLGNMK